MLGRRRGRSSLPIRQSLRIQGHAAPLLVPYCQSQFSVIFARGWWWCDVVQIVGAVAVARIDQLTIFADFP